MYRIISKDSKQILIGELTTIEEVNIWLEDITRDNMLYKKDELEIEQY